MIVGVLLGIGLGVCVGVSVGVGVSVSVGVNVGVIVCVSVGNKLLTSGTDSKLQLASVSVVIKKMIVNERFIVMTSTI